MDNLTPTLSYIYKELISKKELSKDSLNYLLFLCDWKSCIHNDRKITSIKWKIENNRLISHRIEDNHESHLKDMIDYKHYTDKFVKLLKNYNKKNKKANQEIVEKVVRLASKLDDEQIQKTVLSLHPLRDKSEGLIDLVESAREYRKNILPISEV